MRLDWARVGGGLLAAGGVLIGACASVLPSEAMIGGLSLGGALVLVGGYFYFRKQPEDPELSIGAKLGEALVASSRQAFDRPVADPPAYPNWTIHELFFYICPDLLERTNQRRWEKIGLEIRDLLSTGQMQIWGREIDSSTHARSPLVPIPSTYWRYCDFVYFFLEPGHENDPHTWDYMKNEHPQYADLRVDRNQARMLWDPGCPEGPTTVGNSTEVAHG